MIDKVVFNAKAGMVIALELLTFAARRGSNKQTNDGGNEVC